MAHPLPSGTVDTVAANVGRDVSKNLTLVVYA